MPSRTATIALPCGCDGDVTYTMDRASTGDPSRSVWAVDTIATETCPECGAALDLDAVRDRLNAMEMPDAE